MTELKDHLKDNESPQQKMTEHFKMNSHSNSDVSVTGHKGKYCRKEIIEKVLSKFYKFEQTKNMY